MGVNFNRFSVNSRNRSNLRLKSNCIYNSSKPYCLIANVDEMTESFTSQFTDALTRFLPMKPVSFHSITPKIKQLVKSAKKRTIQVYVILRNGASIGTRYSEKLKPEERSSIVRKSTSCQRMTSEGGGRLLTHCLAGLGKNTGFSLQRDGKQLSADELVNSLNSFFKRVNADISPLDLICLTSYLPPADEIPIVEQYEVCRKLSKLQTTKESGPDDIPPCVLHKFAYELADPITKIFNASLSSGKVPALWKVSNITPIPKIPQPKSEGDFRLISLTACTSKVLEDFFVE